MGLSRGEGSPGQSKGQGGEKELRLWGEILGKLLSLSEPQGFFLSINGV